MKKIIAILMVAVIFFSFCSCGVKQSGSDKIAGRWVCKTDGNKYQILIFYDDGVCLRHESDKEDSMSDQHSVYGNWEIRDGYVITFFDISYSAYYIDSEGKLVNEYLDYTYEKVE